MKSRYLIGLGLAAALTLSGCTANDAATTPTPAETAPTETAPAGSEVNPNMGASAEDMALVDAVTVTGPLGSQPEVEFSAPLEVSFPTYRLYSDGEGAALVEGQLVAVDAVSFRGDTGEELFSTWQDNSPSVFIFGGGSMAVLSDMLQGGHVGARVLIANPTTFQGENFTAVNLFEVIETRPTRAYGTAVTPAPGLPTVILDDDGAPEVHIPEGYQPPDELVVQTLIEGDGPVVEPGANLLVHYRGLMLDGEEFDSSWARGEPAGLPLTNVIEGWQLGLAGQRVGSQVLLVIPPDLAYGPDGMGSIPGDATLIFVVDILWAN